MRVVLNGEAVETDAATLEALLEARGFGGKTVATAVNGDFVPAGLRGATQVQDGDRVEVLAPMQGG